MKVLYNPKNDTDFTYQTVCDCGAVLEYTSSDIQKNICRENVVFCPVCLEPVNVLNADDGITYPKDFYHYGNGAQISDSEINEWIKDCIERCKVGGYSSRASGNTMVTVVEYEDGYEVYVSKNYSSTEIDK